MVRLCMFDVPHEAVCVKETTVSFLLTHLSVLSRSRRVCYRSRGCWTPCQTGGKKHVTLERMVKVKAGDLKPDAID